MDTLIFLVSAAVVVTLGYGAFWTVRAVRRAGLRRFAGALGALVSAVVVALFRLFLPQKEASGSANAASAKQNYDAFFATESDQESCSYEVAPRPGFNISTGQLDDGADPGSVYLYGGHNGDDV